MTANSTTTSSLPFIPKVSCLAAALSVLPLLWLFLLTNPSENYGLLAFCLSGSLAVIAFILGLIGLFVARPYAYSIAGVVLSGVVVGFWGFVFLLAVIAAMIALP